MKRIIMTSSAIILISIIMYAATTKAAPAAYPASLDAIDADFMATYYDEINTRQNAYYNSNGQYFQGLRTHTDTPIIGTPELADLLTMSPTDQQYNWLDFWPGISINKDYSIEMHTHRNPSGFGYTMIIRAYDGIDYWIKHRSIGVGGKDTAWQKGR